MSAHLFRRGPMLVVAAGLLVLMLSIGMRQTFGLFLAPMSDALGWGRETFAFAIALQNLVWGLSQPFTGLLADRYGSGRVLVLGGLGYAAGLTLMGQSDSATLLNLSAGLLLGLGLSASSFGIVLGAVARAVPPERRSLALGLTSAGGSVGQLVMLPVAHGLIGGVGWAAALGAMGLLALFVVPLAAALSGRPGDELAEARQSPRQALAEAAEHRGFWLLTLGFSVCGFHVTFVATHLPAYLSDRAIDPAFGALALGTIGATNILGAAFWGMMGGRVSKRLNLTALYALRGVVFTAFVLSPASEIGVLIFAGALGFLWLGTVPLTSALVGQIFGARYLSTLFGIVYLGHQAGAFMGAWLGGYLYDATGSYEAVWYISIALAAISALLHWPIDERPVPRLAAAPEAA